MGNYIERKNNIIIIKLYTIKAHVFFSFLKKIKWLDLTPDKTYKATMSKVYGKL